MLEIKFVKKNLFEVKNALLMRGETGDLDTFESCEAKRREFLFEIEQLRHHRNVVSDQIVAMKKKSETDDDLLKKMRGVSKTIKQLEK
ncbi:MAG TPA: serine--tRNA ligase, partial [Desulfobacterales bacterium]|nr:serine--tRNA ligase [Desulfobacterales bacterium]